MDLLCNERSGIIYIFTASVVTMLIAPLHVIGPQNKIKVSNTHQRVQQRIKRFEKPPQQMQVQSKSGLQTSVDPGSITQQFDVFTQDQGWNRNPNSDASLNFTIFAQGQAAGNVNGDSINGNPVDDYIVTGLARDERTMALEDSTYKTAVFYGGNSTGNPNDVIYTKLIPVGDINGDGYADAIEGFNPLKTNGSQDIYKGSANGYVKTNYSISLLHGEDYRFIGSNDFNGDGSDDILAYSPNGQQVYLFWGNSSFAVVTDPLVQSPLSSSTSKTLAVKDIDQDEALELVEFSGIFGDGQIQVRDINPITGIISLAQNFSFTSFSGFSEDKEMHLLDIDGDGDSEIFISNGEGSSKYIFEYDSLSSQYLTTAMNFYEGQLVPAGDLNNDRHADFILSDSDGKAHISYGTSDLNTLPAQDVDLAGSRNSNWTWNMKYNLPADYNGDGIDDALLFHDEITSNGPLSGRRILYGSKITPTSDFQLYSIDKFLSQVYGTEELGDIDGDGIDDFAIVMSDQRKVEVYFGGSSISSTPDLTITSDYSQNGIASGDFNGDGSNDILLLGGLENAFSGNEVGSGRIEFYAGGAMLDNVADRIINASDFQSVELPDLEGLNSIGDVNDDGVDDFLVGSGRARDTTGTTEYLNGAYIFYGGSTIATTPNSTIDMDPSGDYNGDFIAAGERAVGLGDIDKDGIDDFAVAAPNKLIGDRIGEVWAYLSGSSDPIILTPDGYPNGFGFAITAGDFNGDRNRDIVVGMRGAPSNGALALIYFGGTTYNGGKMMDGNFEVQLQYPDIEFNGSQTVTGNLNFNSGALETIPDFNHDGTDELLLGTAAPNNNAIMFTFNTFSGSAYTILKGPNQAAGLGGPHKIATGDFTDNGQLDVVMTQIQDNNDAFHSSRVYRYELTEPVGIASVQDAPADQGGKLQVDFGGYLIEAAQAGSFIIDSLAVEVSPMYQGTDKPSTKIIKQIPPSTEVSVPKTQPTNVDTIDYSYQILLKAYTTFEGSKMQLQSELITGKAFDNLAPTQISDIIVSDQSEGNVLSWTASSDTDVSQYLIYNLADNGEISTSPLGSVPGTSTSFDLPDNLQGVQNFVVRPIDIHNNEGSTSLPVHAVYPKTVSYETNKGWNLIGLPVNADAEAIQSFLEATGNSAVYEYDGGYQEVEEIEAGKGFWAKFINADLHQLTGLPVTELSLDLDQGWNLISGVGGKLAIASVQDPDEILLPGTVYAFDQAYTASDTLRPSNGYWVRATSAGTVTFFHPKLLSVQGDKFQKTLAKKTVKVEEKFGKITISDGQHSRALYFGAQLPKHVNNLNYTLPPLPPGNIFDARFKAGSRLVEKDEVYIQLNRIEGTLLTLKLNAENLADRSRFIVKEFIDGKFLTEYEINGGEEYPLKHKETNSIFLAPVGSSAISPKNIPEKFSLEQNYPNPFNPTTQIEYLVTKTAPVHLEVFNILGRRVATLVNKEQQPGSYEVTFDASHLASGVYLYRLQAGAKVSTKKLILAK